MVNSELKEKIEKSLREGYTPKEIVETLKEEGYSEGVILTAVKNAEKDIESRNYSSARPDKPSGSSQKTRRDEDNRNQNTRTQNNGSESINNAQRPSNSRENIIPGVDLSDNNYTLKQRLFFNRYRLYDREGGLVMKAKQKVLRMKEDFRFKNSNDEEVMHVKAESIMDVAGDYTLMNNQDDPIAVLEKDWSFLHHKWKIREAGPDERLLAKISSRGDIDILRILGGNIPLLGYLVKVIPHKYDVKNGRDEKIGTIEGKIGIHDIYNIEINSGEIPQETMIASAVAIDALEKN